MRQLRVVTNETCGFACRFCDARRDTERLEIAGTEALRERLDALPEDLEELILTGGEPTRRKDLPAIVAYARARTTAPIIMETNGGELGAMSGAELAKAGLDRVRVHLPDWGTRLDAFTGRPEASGGVRRGIAAFCTAGAEIEAATPVVADNLDSVDDLPERVVADGVRPARWFLRVPWRGPDAASLAPLQAALRQAERFVASAKRVGIPVVFDPAAYLPPCLFERPQRVAHLYALNPGAGAREGYRHVEACAECQVRGRCPGLPTDLDLQPRHPIASERVGRRLTVISTVEEQVRRELVTHETYRAPDGTTLPSAIIRINFHCNQACRFCFVSTHLPPAEERDVESAIDAISERGGMVALSGGEPTLNPRLPDYIRRAKQAGAAAVELQTNAIRLAEAHLAENLRDAGLDVAFVSLHGATADTSDAITNAPGTFDQTLQGLDRLAEAGVQTRINFVLCAPNHAEFPAFVDLVADRWPGAELNCSFVAPSTDLVPRTAELIPRYTDVIPSLRTGQQRAAQRGMHLGGFESMCGVPLCLVPGDLGSFAALADVPAGMGDGEFLKPAACGQCVLEPRCFGIRRGYTELYGTAELQPARKRS